MVPTTNQASTDGPPWSVRGAKGMPLTAGHVFVIPGRLDLLDCDDVVVPTDCAVQVTKTWTSTLDWTDPVVRGTERRSLGWLSDERRVAQLPERSGRRRWLLSVGHGGGELSALTTGLEHCLRVIAGTAALGRRAIRRVGLPTLGFYGHVLGFKGLERPAVVLAVNGFRDEARAREMLYVGLSRARDLLVVCGDPGLIRRVGGDAVAARLGQSR